MRPLVSIVVCCYNREHYLRQTMESIFAQQYDPVEIVVIDDGSTDGTCDLMKRYGDKIRYFRQENQGVVSARTNGCMRAKGEYIAFMDDDDLMPPDRIVVLHGALQKYPEAVMAVGDWAIIDTDGNFTGKRWLPENSAMNEAPILMHDGYEAVLWPKVPAVPHTTLFRKADGERINWFDSSYYQIASDDKDFFARLGKMGPVVYVPKVVSYYRRGHQSLTNNSFLAPYYAIFLFGNHLNQMDYRYDKLRKRLKIRILIELKRMAYYRSKGLSFPEEIPSDYLQKSLSLIGFQARIKYWWYDLLKIPLLRLLKGSDWITL